MISRYVWHATLVFASSLLCACSNGSSGSTPPAEFDVQFQRVFPNLSFSQPVAMVQVPGDPTRFFVVERGGSVRVFDNDPDAATTVGFFTDGNGLVDSGPGEAGLLGMAFHPDYASNATVYLSYTRNGPVSYISRYTVVNGSIDEASEQPLLTANQPAGNHNGGGIAFGPESEAYLYIGFGDGGGSNDRYENAQDTSTLLGAMLRIDVDNVPMGANYGIPPDNPFAASSGCGDAGCPEIYAWGLRNPWRWSFDRQTGDLWAGDVGQGQWEEVDKVERGGNYGWPQREGSNDYCPAPHVCSYVGIIDPVTEYGRSQGYSITGGYVYRGGAIPALQGYYLYGDFGSGRIWALDAAANDPQPVLVVDTSLNIASFAEDQAGEIYVLDYGSGEIHQLVPLL